MSLYSLFMWTEEVFGDLKGKRFDLEVTHLRHTDKLNRLTLVVWLPYVRLVAFGVEFTKIGIAHDVDRADRCDFLKRTLNLNRPLLNGFYAFAWVSGG